jgi:hypothetical protein
MTTSRIWALEMPPSLAELFTIVPQPAVSSRKARATGNKAVVIARFIEIFYQIGMADEQNKFSTAKNKVGHCITPGRN